MLSKEFEKQEKILYNIFQGKSQGHQSKIGDSPHVCAGQQVRALILQAGRSSDLLTLVSYKRISKKEEHYVN